MKSSDEKSVEMGKLTTREAYLSMFIFLDELYKSAKLDDLGWLLSGMSLLEDNNPVDPAMWEIWLESIEKAKDDKNIEIARLKILPE